MKQERNHIDALLLLSVIALMVLSLGVVYSASSTWSFQKHQDSGWMLWFHAIKVAISFGAILYFMRFDYRRLQKYSKYLLIVAVVLLGTTLFLGGEAKGATRWLRFGGFGFQPSELAKYALIVHLAALLVRKGEYIKDYKKGFIPVLVWVGIVSVLVLAQPNFSNGAMIFAIGMILLYLSGARLLHMVATFSPLIVMLGLYMVAAPYRMKRLISFFGEPGYQLRQGIIAFGNGGLFGVGMGESRQRDLFLPESYGDFVFSIVGEEYGLVGTIFFLTLFLTVMLRGMKIAKYARDQFGRYLAVGITTSVTLYALINAGVTVGILPTTGLPMPFVSYGGSSMFFSAIAIGILLNISSQTDLHPRLHGAEGVRPLEPAVPQGAG